jgi:2'-5' RNA ligase
VRVFTAIFPPEDVVDHLAQRVEPVQRAHPELRWTLPPLWHLTLAFFGNITESDSVLLNDAVQTFVAEREALQVRLAGAGAFPEPEAAEILWAGVDAPGHALADMSRELIASVLHFGWLLDRRSFRAHVTLARSRPERDLSAAVEQLADYRGPMWTVPSIAVVWSRRGPDGEPLYELLCEHPFPLG